MPTTVSGLTFYEEQFETGYYQGLTQSVDAFNAASGGAIILGTGAAKGRAPRRTFFQAVSGLVQRRDPASTGNLTPSVLRTAEHKSIKLFNSSPLIFRMQDWRDTGLSEDVGTFLFGVQYGEAIALRYLNSAIAALVGAIQAVGATAIYDNSGTGAMTYGVLNSALAKFGDRRQAINALVAYSKPLNDLIGQAFTSQQVAFQLGTATIYNGSMPSLGLKSVQTDAAPLFINNTGTDHYWSLALRPGAVEVKTGPSSRIFSVVTGTASATPENHSWLLSIEDEFEVSVMGVSYTHATANPNDAALADPANWTHVTGASVDVKNGPGIAIKTQ